MIDQPPVVLRGWPAAAKSRPDASRERFRHNLARVMADRGMTQAGLARAMDVSRVAVHAWIWGTCFPETARLIKLATALGVPVGSLLESEAGRDGEPSIEEAMLLSAFRRLPDAGRLALLADVHEMSARAGTPLRADADSPANPTRS